MQHNHDGFLREKFKNVSFALHIHTPLHELIFSYFSQASQALFSFYFNKYCALKYENRLAPCLFLLESFIYLQLVVESDVLPLHLLHLFLQTPLLQASQLLNVKKSQANLPLKKVHSLVI